MKIYFWIIFFILFFLYLYINRNKKQKENYYQEAMAFLQMNGVSSEELLKKLSSYDSGQTLVHCFKQKKSPKEAAEVLLKLYNKNLTEK